jgi:RNA recognition motif-containing protein
MSRRRLHVSNLSRFTSEEELKAAFAKHGPVRSVSLVRDGLAGQTEGLGFIEYETDEGAVGGLLALNGSMLHGRLLSVAIAQESTLQPAEQGST